ncbi:hypothetical protein N7532_010966 [Penicillium argentinense]|uniref:Uncharacterized protein n=1 Tax=Penicillium argentinense TaxID=1131581 RepID=A0A9W9EQV8_9EURO|nr:uncharacterized protein N7532_010966 [Penicillium argentinense]KAJ5086195.1 hypothetical protein N7532_010966 [Penicillium argentinense]
MGSEKKRTSTISNNRNLSASGEAFHDRKLAQSEPDLEHVENMDSHDNPKSPTRIKQAQLKLHKHWRRFWCCYLVAVVIFLAIFLPVFFLVAIPAIAQRIVDDTDLPIYGAQILNPKPDRVSFTLHTSLDVPLGLRIRTDPFDLRLFDRNISPTDPYITVGLPTYSLKGKTDMIITRNDTRILNQGQFVETLTRAVYNEKFTLSAKGSTVGHLGALKAPLTLNKDVELNGLNKLSGFSIQSARLLFPNESNGNNLVGTANLPNHSVFTFALGNVTLNLKSVNLTIGQATIENVVLRPGNNPVSLKGTLDIDTVLDNLEDMLAAQKSALEDGDVELSASGNSTVYDGIHIDYYEEILNNLTLTTRIPILEVLGDTLQGLLDNKNSSLGNVLRNVTSILGDLTASSDISNAARSLRVLI